MMVQMQSAKESGNDPQEDSKEKIRMMAVKMNRLEAALRLMNEKKKQERSEHQETSILRTKLAAFEERIIQLGTTTTRRRVWVRMEMLEEQIRKLTSTKICSKLESDFQIGIVQHR